MPPLGGVTEPPVPVAEIVILLKYTDPKPDSFVFAGTAVISIVPLAAVADVNVKTLCLIFWKVTLLCPSQVNVVEPTFTVMVISVVLFAEISNVMLETPVTDVVDVKVTVPFCFWNCKPRSVSQPSTALFATNSISPSLFKVVELVESANVTVISWLLGGVTPPPISSSSSSSPPISPPPISPPWPPLTFNPLTSTVTVL